MYPVENRTQASGHRRVYSMVGDQNEHSERKSIEAGDEDLARVVDELAERRLAAWRNTRLARLPPAASAARRGLETTRPRLGNPRELRGGEAITKKQIQYRFVDLETSDTGGRGWTNAKPRRIADEGDVFVGADHHTVKTCSLSPGR